VAVQTRLNVCTSDELGTSAREGAHGRVHPDSEGVQSTEWIMADASSSAAASLPSGQLPGSGPEMGSNGGFGVLEVEQPLLEQTVAGRVKAALYALIAVGEANDRPGRPASLDLKVVKEVLKATRTVHAELNTEQPVKLKAMGIANLKVALAFAIADQLGCASVLVRERGIDEYKIAACIKIGKYVLTRVSRSVIDFPDCSRTAFEAEFAPVTMTMQAAAGVVTMLLIQILYQ